MLNANELEINLLACWYVYTV